MAVIIEFYGSGRLGSERNLCKGGGRRSKIKRRVGLGEWRLRLPDVIVILQNSVRPWAQFLIGAVKFQLSITSQMCHLSVVLTFHSYWRTERWRTLIVKLLVSIRYLFCRSYFFSSWKKTASLSLIDSTCVCFCRKTVLPIFNSTHIDWLPVHFRKCRDAQLIRVCSVFNSFSRQAASCPSPAISNIAGRINDRELITLARSNKTSAL